MHTVVTLKIFLDQTKILEHVHTLLDYYRDHKTGSKGRGNNQNTLHIHSFLHNYYIIPNSNLKILK